MKFLNITIAFLLVISFRSNSQTIPDKNIFYWTTDKKLSFENFKGKPVYSDTTANSSLTTALTHKLGSINKSIDVNFKTSGGKTTFTIRAGMDQNSSWIKNLGDTISLKHEQGHFDICEIFARRLRKEIKTAKSLAEARSLYEMLVAEEELGHDAFDSANTYLLGGITEQWKLKIGKDLKDLEQFSTPVVVVPISK